MSDPITTIVGNLASDIDLRFTQSGDAVANFLVAHNTRRFNKQTNAWEDGDALFMRCAIWKQAAENMANSLTKGQRIIVTGKLIQQNFEDRDGNKRSSIQMVAEEVGPSLKWSTATVTKASTSTSSGGGGGFQAQQPASDAWGSAPAEQAPF